MTEQITFDVRTIAESYVAGGLSIIPIAAGSKRPDTELLPRMYDDSKGRTVATWRPFQERLAFPKELDKWYSKNSAGIGVVCGAVSGGLVVLDCDQAGAYEAWRTLAGELVEPGILDSLPVVTSGKGHHVYLRMPEPIGNIKLATIGESIIIETRGEGGYIVAPPTIHPDGRQYKLIAGDIANTPMLSRDVALCLFDAARALAPTAGDSPVGQAGGDKPTESVIDAFNKARTIEATLEALGYQMERPGRYIRPGGERASVIVKGGRSTHYNTSDPLHAEAPGGGLYAHSAFSAWCVVNHAGDMKAAVKAAAIELGISKKADQRPITDDQQLLGQAGRLLGLASGAAANEEEASDPWPYFVHEGGMWMHQTAADGSPKVPLLLTNFVAHIISETGIDDGEQITEQYTIRATCGRRTKEITMSREDFEGETATGRIVATLGARARINPKAQSRYIIDGIKALSPKIEERIIHAHTGWVKGRYLMSNGYVDSEGWHPTGAGASSWCELPARLARYRLSAEGPLSEALSVFDDLLELAPSSVMVPLVGGVLLSPLAGLMDVPSPMVHVYGPTGSHKTSITVCALCLWGDFAPSHPTDTWTSTANSVQRLGWHLKDAPMMLDDYKIAHVKANSVTFLLQNYGDGMARGRLDANSEARAAFPIRGVLISCGEDQPEGEASTLARILSIDLARGSVHRGRMTRVQDDSRALHVLTIGYLQWLAGQLAGGQLGEQCRQLHQATRAAVLARLEEAPNATNPGRVASNVASLHVSWAMFVEYLVSAGHWSESRASTWLATCKRDLMSIAKRQVELTTNERYSALFIDAVQSLLASGKCVLHDLTNPEQTLTTGQVLIGSKNSEGVFLMTSALDEVAKHYRAAGKQITFSVRALSQLLHQDGLLLTTAPPSLVVKRRVNGIPAWCWHLPLSIVDG